MLLGNSLLPRQRLVVWPTLSNILAPNYCGGDINVQHHFLSFGAPTAATSYLRDAPTRRTSVIATSDRQKHTVGSLSTKIKAKCVRVIDRLFKITGGYFFQDYKTHRSPIVFGHREKHKSPVRIGFR
jgi:hypothetical protein